MSQNLQNFMKGASMLRSVAVRVPTDAWDRPTCCEGWSAREVAGHITWGLNTVASIAQGGGMAEQAPEADIAGDDPGASVMGAVDAAVAAIDAPGTLDQSTPAAFGGMSLDQFLALMAVDSMTHAWDISDAVGIEHGIDAASAATALATIAPMADRMRGPGRFGEAVSTDSTDPVEQLIAFTGRRSVHS